MATQTVTAPLSGDDIRDLRDDVIAALVQQGYRRGDATTAANLSNANKFDPMFRESLDWLHSHRIGGSPEGKREAKGKPEAPKTVVAIASPAIEKPAAETKTCACAKCEGCPNPVRMSSMTGVCAACQQSQHGGRYLAKSGRPKLERGRQPDNPPEPEEAPMHRSPQEVPKPQPTPAPPSIAPNHDGRFDVRLSEPQINRFLDGMELDWKEFVRLLPVELKLQLVNHYFFNNLDEPRDEPRAQESAAA